jgi:multidrug transporter EmrE-like cation transporter
LRASTVALFLLIAISLGAFGQISLKYGMKHFDLGPLGPRMALRVVRAVFTPYVFLGLALYAVSSGFWLVVLSKWNLSYAYPMIAISYVAVVLLSRVFFRDHVLPLQWVGIVLMSTGLVLVSYFGSATGTTR